MIHAREDYMRFQDPWNKIGIDEPVFLMRAQDDAFCKILAFAIEEYRKQQAGDVVARLERHLELARAWRETHPTKVADVPAFPCVAGRPSARAPIEDLVAAIQGAPAAAGAPEGGSIPLDVVAGPAPIGTRPEMLCAEVDARSPGPSRAWYHGDRVAEIAAALEAGRVDVAVAALKRAVYGEDAAPCVHVDSLVAAAGRIGYRQVPWGEL